MAKVLAVLMFLAGVSTQALEPGGKPVEVKASTAPAPSVGSIYTVEKLRDPFTPAASGSSRANTGKPFDREDFNIHNLSLKGIMKDSGVEYALFNDNNFGVSFILRKGKLYDDRGKMVAGVAGSINVKKKTAHLMTEDKDVQVFRLGEEEPK
ncbi:MAG: hypothetical protein HY921_05665 [Elusimicrobia bacterium]|nr:hypothetical protein [Elusimicrobiota bacterium]